MIIQEDFDSLKTLWRKQLPFIGQVQKQRLTYGARVVTVVQFKLFGHDVSIAKTTNTTPETLPFPLL